MNRWKKLGIDIVKGVKSWRARPLAVSNFRDLRMLMKVQLKQPRNLFESFECGPRFLWIPFFGFLITISNL